MNFTDAFNHTMLYEIGAFNPKDPDVIAGRIDTPQQRKKVGYVNIPQDRGGETKYGIAQNGNKVVVIDLDLKSAMDIYYKNYWLAGSCDKLPAGLALIHFDGCVNHGVGRACKFLQRAAKVNEDGIIGPATLKAVSPELISRVADIRKDFYLAIVDRDPTQKMFLSGWLRRVNEVEKYSKGIV